MDRYGIAMELQDAIMDPVFKSIRFTAVSCWPTSCRSRRCRARSYERPSPSSEYLQFESGHLNSLRACVRADMTAGAIGSSGSGDLATVRSGAITQVGGMAPDMRGQVVFEDALELS